METVWRRGQSTTTNTTFNTQYTFIAQHKGSRSMLDRNVYLNLIYQFNLIFNLSKYCSFHFTSLHSYFVPPFWVLSVSHKKSKSSFFIKIFVIMWLIELHYETMQTWFGGLYWRHETINWWRFNRLSISNNKRLAWGYQEETITKIVHGFSWVYENSEAGFSRQYSSSFDDLSYY
jgi:hypothetical protein